MHDRARPSPELVQRVPPPLAVRDPVRLWRLLALGLLLLELGTVLHVTCRLAGPAAIVMPVSPQPVLRGHGKVGLLPVAAERGKR